MAHASKCKQVRYIIVFTTILLMAIGVTVSMYKRKVPLIEKQVVENTRALSVIENYFGMQLTAGIRRISTCYSYDSSASIWGVYIVASNKEIAGISDFSDWEIVTTPIRHPGEFPMSIDCRSVMWSNTVKWWNPSYGSASTLYQKSDGATEYKVLIENTSAEWVRIFAVMQAIGRDMPSAVEKMFADRCQFDIIKTYGSAPEDIGQGRTDSHGFNRTDPNAMAAMIEDCGVFLGGHLSLELATYEPQTGETVFVFKKRVEMNDLSTFMEQFVKSGETLNSVFRKYSPLDDRRGTVANIKSPLWYTMPIKHGWRYQKKYVVFFGPDYELCIRHIYVDDSYREHAYIYLDGSKRMKDK